MTPWVLRLIIANAAIYLLLPASSALYQQMVLVPQEVLTYPWTPVTYMFLHGGLGHLFWNMLALFFFGPRVEERLGARRFLILYFLSGISGAALSFLFSPTAAIIGASGAIFGVMLAFARFWPRVPIYIWGILPIEARWMIVGMTVISLLGARTGAGGIAHFAHLGGFLGAFIYLRFLEWNSGARQFREAAAPKPRVSGARRTADIERWSHIRRDSLHEVNRAEVDRILDKIGSSGISSLTPAERETLDRFSQQLN